MVQGVLAVLMMLFAGSRTLAASYALLFTGQRRAHHPDLDRGVARAARGAGRDARRA